MASTTRIRLRRSAAQLHALAHIEREIRATDPHGRRKYLREFNESFQTYESVLSDSEYRQAILSADVLLVGDYHALPRSQQYAAELVRELAEVSGRKVMLGVESLFARDQHIVDEWQAGECDDEELRERVRFDHEWGYEWEPFYNVLRTARDVGARVFALDSMPRGDLRRIAQRDRHAAQKIAEIHAAHPEAIIVVLFGESHLAPSHLPALVKEAVPRFEVLTVLQNVDALYWSAAGEKAPVKAVRVEPGVICVLNASPLEKYESYRQCIERWKREHRDADLAPSFYNLIDALASFLTIEKFASETNPQPECLYDIIPEVVSRNSAESLRKVLERKRATEAEIREALAAVERLGSAYVQRLNLIAATHYDLNGASEAVARFVHAVCMGEVGRAVEQMEGEQQFYAECVREMVAYIGSRILHPSREAWREIDLYSHYTDVEEDVATRIQCSYAEYMRTIDFLVMHKDYECNARRYRYVPSLIVEGRAYAGDRRRFSCMWLGRMLGTQVYEAFVAGKLHKRTLRAVMWKRGREAKTVYFQLAKRTRKSVLRA